jgi:hypothetical protein
MSTVKYSDDIENRRKIFNAWLDRRASQLTPHHRVIFDKMPTTLRYPNHGTLEWATYSWDKSPNKGWGKPDKMIGKNIEVRYLWK